MSKRKAGTLYRSDVTDFSRVSFMTCRDEFRTHAGFVEGEYFISLRDTEDAARSVFLRSTGQLVNAWYCDLTLVQEPSR